MRARLAQAVPTRRGLATLAGLAMTAVSVAVLIPMLMRDLPALFARDARPDPLLLGACFALYSAALLLALVGWHAIGAAVMPGAPVVAGSAVYVISLAARRLPGGILGTAGRIALYARLGVPWQQTATAMAIEAAVVTTAGAALATVLVPAIAAVGPAARIALAAPVLVVPAILIRPTLLGRAIGWLAARGARSGSGPALPVLRRTHIASWLATYGGTWALGGLVLYALARALGAPPTDPILPYVAAWAVAGTIASLLWFVPSGLGIVEVTLAGILTAATSAPEPALLAIAMRVVVTLGEAAWAALATATTVSALRTWRNEPGSAKEKSRPGAPWSY